MSGGTSAPPSPGPALAEVLARAEGLVGRWEREDCGVVTAKEFRRYAAAVDDTGYLRAARAAEAAGRPVTAPPLFLTGILSWEDGPVEAELRPDGLSARESPCTRGLPVRQVHGGQSVRLGRPLEAGARVRADRAVRSATAKRGRSGDLVVLAVTTRFTGEDGAELASVDETIIVMDLP